MTTKWNKIDVATREQHMPDKFNGDKKTRARLYKMLKESGIGSQNDRIETLEKKMDFILQFIILDDKE